ncbi:hypothetical protein [Metabacillus fastidiosus]|uniref:hypothetical protein n=1 Tax=Metabacillus fastidiosus TaxID=1458 RepID=UPI002DBD68DD|nr:hypothetical protein [Metabacillus fastidiosus]MEC2075676.1 hypothetical protein [Metabacillus fastidiosus]
MHKSVLDIIELLQERPVSSVRPDIIWSERLDTKIAAMPLKKLFPEDNEEKVYGLALQAAFFILNDSLSKAHDVLQDPLVYDKNETGDYWHALMHRKEGDYNNSKNWFPPVHPIHEQLNSKMREYLEIQSVQDGGLQASLQKLSEQSTWDPSLFVDVVEEEVKKGFSDEARTILNNIQWIELELLLDFTCKHAFGKGIAELAPSI